MHCLWCSEVQSLENRDCTFFVREGPSQEADSARTYRYIHNKFPTESKPESNYYEKSCSLRKIPADLLDRRQPGRLPGPGGASG